MKINRKTTVLVSALVLSAGIAGLASAAGYIPWSDNVTTRSGPIKSCPNNTLCLYTGRQLSGQILYQISGTAMSDAARKKGSTYYSWTRIPTRDAKGQPVYIMSVANATLGRFCTYTANLGKTNIIGPRSAFNLLGNQPGDSTYVGYPC